ncbi:MAG: hypothetical protein EBR82_73810 [Caulobacteraceae bacterium]|nr:hypothetical protein [Caulobacteraceae bacterium]
MSCALTQGFILGCNDAVGGIKNIYFINYTEIASTTFTNGELTGVTTVNNPSNVYLYQPNKNTGSVTFNPTVSLENGTVFFTHQLVFTLGKLSNIKREELELLSRARVVVFVEMNDTQTIVLGLNQGAFMTAGTFQTGATFGDLQGYQITITADETSQPYFLPVGDDVTDLGLVIA